MAESGSRWRPLHFHRDELTVHNLAIDDDRFKVAQLVLQLPLRVLATKVVNSVQHRVALQPINEKLDVWASLLTFLFRSVISALPFFAEMTVQQAPWMKGAIPYFNCIFIHSMWSNWQTIISL